MATRSNYDYPTNSPMTDADGNVTLAWRQWIQRTHTNASTLQMSGTTADRPDKVLWIGRFYFDTSLGKPIWIKQVIPTVIWVDGVGTAV